MNKLHNSYCFLRAYHTLGTRPVTLPCPIHAHNRPIHFTDPETGSKTFCDLPCLRSHSQEWQSQDLPCLKQLHIPATDQVSPPPWDACRASPRSSHLQGGGTTTTGKGASTGLVPTRRRSVLRYGWPSSRRAGGQSGWEAGAHLSSLR